MQNVAAIACKTSNTKTIKFMEKCQFNKNQNNNNQNPAKKTEQMIVGLFWRNYQYNVPTDIDNIMS